MLESYTADENQIIIGQGESPDPGFLPILIYDLISESVCPGLLRRTPRLWDDLLPPDCGT